MYSTHILFRVHQDGVDIVPDRHDTTLLALMFSVLTVFTIPYQCMVK